MTEGSWRDRIAAERMQIDQEFADRIAASPLSSQQWGLIMTAVEFDIDSPADPESAELVADTSKLSSVMHEIRRMGERGAGGGASIGTAGEGGGLLNSVKQALGFGSEDDELRETAESLVADYTAQLQSRLEERDRWEAICEAAR